MDDNLFKAYGKDDPVKATGGGIADIMGQQRTSTLTKLSTEISVWAVKTQVRMQEELRWLQALQGTAGLTAVQADTNVKTATSLAGQVNDLYKETT